jgi:hypothetical protein
MILAQLGTKSRKRKQDEWANRDSKRGANIDGGDFWERESLGPLGYVYIPTSCSYYPQTPIYSINATSSLAIYSTEHSVPPSFTRKPLFHLL